MPDLVLVALARLNVVLASATVLLAFSLLAYLFVYNFRDLVARAFVALLAFVTLVYVGDVFLATARLPASHPAAAFWLRFEWLGIAFVAPAYALFANALLAATGDRSSRRRWAIAASFVGGGVALAAVLAGDALVDGVVGGPGTVRLQPGRWFPVFAIGYLVLTAWGARGVWRAGRRSLTARSRRRMTYLRASVVAPLSVFPYLLAGATAVAQNPALFQIAAAAANVAIAISLVVVAYPVAYHGALTPDRVVKRELAKYLIQGPTLGVFVIATIQAVPVRLEASLGLPRDIVFAMAVMVGIVAYQLVVRAVRPAVDYLVFGPQSRELMWLRRLDERLLTPEDLSQLLETILAALCDRARVQSGAVLVLDEGTLQVDVRIGSEERAMALLDALQAGGLAALYAGPSPQSVDGFRVWALRPPSGGALLGLLAMATPDETWTDHDDDATAGLVDGAARALADRLVQQGVVASLKALEPELADMQRFRGALERGADDAARMSTDATLVHDPDFPHWVKDALSHYWGGPKLTESPLLRLRVARQALEEHDENPARAMRAVLDQALERLKPEGERSATASQWLVYNILELKFVRGLRVRDIARRLAMSESDLYRKQRVAVEALSRQLAAMEGEPTPADGDPGEGDDGVSGLA